MTRKKSPLTNFMKKTAPTVSFGDDNKWYTLGYGSIVLENVIIENVALVAGLKLTLLRINQLGDKYYQYVFDNRTCSITNNRNDIVLTGQRNGNIYEANFENNDQTSIKCLYSNVSTE